jgi:hypothetical protein
VSGIGLLNEGALHAALKAYYALPGDELEAAVNGYVVDIRRGETCIEIQTGHFQRLRRKVTELLTAYRVHLVHPVAARKRLVYLDEAGAELRSRKSPKRGSALDMFDELVHAPELIGRPGLSLEVLLLELEERRAPARNRRGWRVAERRLLNVSESLIFCSPADYLRLLPRKLAEPFTNRELAAALGRRLERVRRLSYVLRRIGVLELVGRRGNAHLLRRA